ncbi:MAG: CocE/NonD family hydrolase [Mucilaginibacter sp.]
MRKLLTIILLLFTSTTAFTQKLYFAKANYTDSVLFERNITGIAAQLIEKYQETSKSKYYRNLGFLQLLTGQYAKYPSTLTAYGIAAYGDSVSTKDLDFPFRVYAAVMVNKPQKNQFTILYQPQFMALFNALPKSCKNFIDSYFNIDPASIDKKFTDNVKQVSEKDSLTLAEAVLLCRNYCAKKVFGATMAMGKKALKQIEKDTYIITDSVLLKMPDGGTIALAVVRSRAVNVAQPVVLKYNIYAGNEIGQCKDAVERGYIGVVANTRGKRLSPDGIEPFEHDAKDAYYIIDWISKQSWCNGKIGMYGGSYLGFGQWSTAKYIHPALKTIVPQASVGAGIDYPMENNVFMSFSLRWLHFVMNNKLTDADEYRDDKRWAGLFNKWYKNGSSFRSLDSLDGRPNAIFQRWLQHPAYDSFWQSMTPQKAEFANIKIPVFSTTGFFDDDQLGAMYYYRQYHQWNKNPNYYLLIGPYSHTGSQDYPTPEVGGYKIDSVGNVPLIDVVYQWFDHILKGKQLPPILKDRVNFEMMGENKWHHVPSLAKMNKDTLKLYLGNTLAKGHYPLLSTKPLKKSFINHRVDLARRDSVITDSKVDEPDQVIDSVLKEKPELLIFKSRPLTKPLLISGSFKASIIASINKKDMDLVVQLYEQTPQGKFMKLSTNHQRASYAASRYKRNLLTPGKITAINLNNNFITCKKLEKGSRIIVMIGVNKGPDWQINYGSGKDVSDETIKDAAIPMDIKWYNNSCIKIPVLRN